MAASRCGDRTISPSTRPRIKQALWKSYVHARKSGQLEGVDLHDLTIDSPNAVLGGSHIATGPHQFASAMSGLDIDPRGCTFVDLGSGKGRALIMAAGYPFACIVGVEFAEEAGDQLGARRCEGRQGKAVPAVDPNEAGRDILDDDAAFLVLRIS